MSWQTLLTQQWSSSRQDRPQISICPEQPPTPQAQVAASHCRRLAVGPALASRPRSLFLLAFTIAFPRSLRSSSTFHSQGYIRAQEPLRLTTRAEQLLYTWRVWLQSNRLSFASTKRRTKTRTWLYVSLINKSADAAHLAMFASRTASAKGVKD